MTRFVPQFQVEVGHDDCLCVAWRSAELNSQFPSTGRLRRSFGTRFVPKTSVTRYFFWMTRFVPQFQAQVGHDECLGVAWRSAEWKSWFPSPGRLRRFFWEHAWTQNVCYSLFLLNDSFCAPVPGASGTWWLPLCCMKKCRVKRLVSVSRPT
jgi:hypothetical protein